jgi:hypothetical protein
MPKGRLSTSISGGTDAVGRSAGGEDLGGDEGMDLAAAAAKMTPGLSLTSPSFTIEPSERARNNQRDGWILSTK